MCVAVLLIRTPLAPGMSRAAFDALHSVARIGRKYPDIELHISSGSTNDIIRGLENGQINLGFIRPVENIGSLRFFSIAHERYLLAVEKKSALLTRSEIDIEDLKGRDDHLVTRRPRATTSSISRGP